MQCPGTMQLKIPTRLLKHGSWVLCCVLLLGLSCGQEAKTSSMDYVRVDEQKHFKVHEEWVSWCNASETCQQEGGHLAVPLTLEQYLAIARLTHFHPWVGIHKERGSFVTVTGEPLSSLPFFKWARDEPDGSGDCVFLDTDVHALFDFQCDDVDVFVCERLL